MKKIALVVVSLIAGVSAAQAPAMILEPLPVKCPIGGETFTATLALSGTQMGQNLDRRPVGAIASPWPLAKCPKNGFVLFKDEFTPAEIKKLQPFVVSREYQTLQKTESNYFLASRLMATLGAPKDEVASALLRATWEVEKSPRYPRYAADALAAIEALLSSDSKLDADERASYQQIAGELERRLGRFDAAQQRLTRLYATPGVPGTPLGRLVLQELDLIRQRDVGTHLADTGDGSPRRKR